MRTIEDLLAEISRARATRIELSNEIMRLRTGLKEISSFDCNPHWTTYQHVEKLRGIARRTLEAIPE